MISWRFFSLSDTDDVMLASYVWIHRRAFCNSIGQNGPIGEGESCLAVDGGDGGDRAGAAHVDVGHEELRIARDGNKGLKS